MTEEPALQIRPESVTDADAIDAVVRAAFGGEVEPRLVRLIRSSDLFLPELSLVAEVAGDLVGHVMVSHVFLDPAGADEGSARAADAPLPQSDAARRLICSLAPLAVAPGHQGRGIGGALVRAVTAAAIARGEPLLILEGSPAYYGRFGFEPAADHGILLTVPDWAPPEAAQVLRLPAHDPAIRGRVTYPPAFEEATSDH